MGNSMSFRLATRIGLVAASVASAATFATSAKTAKLIHLLSWASYFGTSVWISFFQGIIAFKTIPRHMFGRLQSKMFPVYFAFQTGTLALSLAAALKENPPDSLSDAFARPDLRLLAGSLAVALANLIWFEPWTTSLMWKRHAIERELGTGHEVGILKPLDPVKANDPRLVAISKKFGMLHGISVSLNLLALCCTGAHAAMHLV